MDIGTFRGILTLILMVLFIALVLWAYSRRRHADFEAAARLPLEEYPESGRESIPGGSEEGRT